MELESMRKPIAVDLFSGAGGLSEGLRQAGFEPRVAVDFDHHALASYKANHPETATILADVASVTGDEIKRLANADQIDLVAGGPSCQGFSTHGKRIQDDPRNYLFKHFVRLVEEIQPKLFLMENVKGMLTYSNGLFRKQIERAFHEIGYKTFFSTVMSADYGVPQLRNRVIFVGTPYSGIELSAPKPTHGKDGSGLIPFVTVGEALEDLPLIGSSYDDDLRDYAGPPSTTYQRYLRNGASSKVSLHVSRPLSGQAAAIAEYVKPGSGLRSVPVEVMPERFRKMRTISDGSLRRDCTTLYYRLSKERPAYTITCYYRNIASGPFLHPQENRALSHREAARLMSFPDRYRFEGSHIPRQIGNAVPVLMARAIGIELLRTLRTIDSKLDQIPVLGAA